MNRFRPSLRRMMTLAAAAVIGVLGVLVVASPASAHHSIVNGKGWCDTTKGTWVVVWKVEEVSPSDAKKVKFYEETLEVVGSTYTGPLPYTKSSVVLDKYNKDTVPYPYAKTDAPFTVTQEFDGATTSVELKVKLRWDNGYEEGAWQGAEVTFDKKCEQDKPAPYVSHSSACDGSVEVVLSNKKGLATAKFTIVGEPALSRDVLKGEETTVTVPATHQGNIVVKEGDSIEAEFPWEQPEDCTPVEISSKEDCTTLTIELSNPTGPVHHYVVKSGDKTLTGDLAVGETKVLEPFPATAGTTATVAIDNDAPTTITWTSQTVCIPDLPKTGSSITPLLSVGGALLVGGAGMIGLLFMLRRRRTTAAG